MESENGGRDVPWELMREILIKLPVKPLLRFTCVCKSWRTLIRSDPDFAIRQYLTQSTSSSSLMDNVDYFVDYAGSLRGNESAKDDKILKLYMYVLTANKTFRIVKKLEFGGAALKLRFSNFCHGMLCIRVSVSKSSSSVGAPKGGNGVVLMCNPATGEVVEVPSSVNIKNLWTNGFGIGFDSVMNDYKILAIINNATFYNWEYDPWIVDVYSVRRGCWRNLHANEIGLVQQFGALQGPVVLNANDRILNMIGTYRSLETRFGILSFDSVDEVFRVIPMPRCQRPRRRDHDLLPTSRWLASVCCSPPPSIYHGLHKNEAIDIWVLSCDISADLARDGSDLEHMWIKQISVRFPDQEVAVWPVNLWMNDNELFVYVKRRESSKEEVFFYDLGTQELKRTGRQGTVRSPGGYMESLISFKGLMSSCSGAGVLEKRVDDSTNDGGRDHGSDPEDTYDCEPTCFIREVSIRNDVHWCYNFTLV